MRGGGWGAVERVAGGANADVAGGSGAGVDAYSPFRPGDRVRVMVRPEALRLQPAAVAAGVGSGAAGDGVGLEGEVVERRFAGPVTHYRVRAGTSELLVHGGAHDAEVGDRVTVHVAATPLAFRANAPSIPQPEPGGSP